MVLIENAKAIFFHVNAPSEKKAKKNFFGSKSKKFQKSLWS
jgi:hypothetical protein